MAWVELILDMDMAVELDEEVRLLSQHLDALCDQFRFPQGDPIAERFAERIKLLDEVQSRLSAQIGFTEMTTEGER